MNDLVVHPFQGRGIGLVPELEKSAYSAHDYEFTCRVQLKKRKKSAATWRRRWQ